MTNILNNSHLGETQEYSSLVSALIDERELERKHKEWLRNRVKNTLKAALQKIHDRKKDIDYFLDNEKPRTAWYYVKALIRNEIVAAVEDIMVVPEYSHSGGPKQQIYVYNGTHWELTRIQLYYDFIRKACQKMGLEDIYVRDQDKMNEVFENVAFSVSKDIQTAQPVDGVWINLSNCTVEINNDGTISTHDHRPEDFFHYSLPYCYDTYEQCPLWHKFLDEVLPEKEAQALLGEFIGYCFTRNLKLEKMAVFYGGGANGKSVCLDVIRNLFGRNNVSESTLSALTNNPEVRSVLQNKLINISSESGKCLDSATLKMLISGEPVDMRILYVGTKKLENPPKLITAYNDLPPVENTHGYRRRWILFPFDRTIPDNQQDPSLAKKLCLELPGILNWVLQNLANLIAKVNQNNGMDFTESKVCNDALSSYFRNSNSALTFAEECCTKTDGLPVKLMYAYNCYKSYCIATGVTKPMLKKNFSKALSDWGARIEKIAKVDHAYLQIDSSAYL